MNLQNDRKIKQLYQILPEGVVAPASWLAEQGYSMQLLYQVKPDGLGFDNEFLITVPKEYHAR